MFKTHRCSFAGRNHLCLFFGTRRAIRDSRRARLRLKRTSDRRPPVNADELCRGCAKDRTALCSGCLLLLGRAQAICLSPGPGQGMQVGGRLRPDPTAVRGRSIAAPSQRKRLAPAAALEGSNCRNSRNGATIRTPTTPSESFRRF
jgi:hypothetical protein